MKTRGEHLGNGHCQQSCLQPLKGLQRVGECSLCQITQRCSCVDLTEEKNVDLEYMFDFIFVVNQTAFYWYQQVDFSDAISPTWWKELGYFVSFHSDSVQF